MKNTQVYGINNYDNYILQGVQARKYYGAVCTVLFLVGYIFYLNCIVAVCMMALAIPFKKTYIKFKIKQQKDLLRHQFRDLLYSLSSSVSSGRQMSEALIEGSKNLSYIYDEGEPIMVELKYMTTCIKESRITDEMILKDFAYRSGVEEIISFADVYSTCRATGADVGDMIAKAAEIIMDKMTIDREIKTITAQKKAEAKIITSMPMVIIVFLNFVSPGYLDSLYHTFAGHIIMTAALGTIIISYYIMNKILEVRL
ncbi:type II secretion system F family protein [Aminipila terrae]|uniref:Type II secretion system protein GspF domain-containing protein n=1 Tax=Aminipila terrae TaxID=2697030 RepID=A0A6P1M8L1_9FIRM|nr:type II secretion system F family protein [Aminipila terrae]QHI71069.1 hypothetical protein Ami3637_00510 [Aminipila terrae]